MNALIIARFSLHEAVRRRFVLIGAVMSALFLLVFGAGFAFIFEQAVASRGRPPSAQDAAGAAALTLMGLYGVSILSGLLGVFTSASAISGELESGTLHAIIARPIRRSDYILGRWLASLVVIGVYVAGMTTVLLGIAYVIAGYVAPEPMAAMALMILSAAVLATLALSLSAVLSPMAAGVVVLSLFGLSWIAGIIEFIGSVLQRPAMVNIGIGVSLLVPSDAVWRGASYYVQSPAANALMANGQMPFVSTSPPTSMLVGWTLLHVLITLSIGMRAFAKRDL